MFLIVLHWSGLFLLLIFCEFIKIDLLNWLQMFCFESPTLINLSIPQPYTTDI